MSPFDDYDPPSERQIHGFLGYFTLAASLLTLGSTVTLVINQYDRASRSLSTRQGVHRRKLVVLFLALAVACFVVVTGLKYGDEGARREVVDRLAGAHEASGYDGRDKRRGLRWDEEGEQVEVPSSQPGRHYIAVKQETWISQWLNEQLPFELSFDAGAVLDKWLPPFHSSADYWWSSEYYWGALTWLFFLSFETRLRALPRSTPILLTLVAMYFGLAGSQSLLYALMLMSPIRDANMERWAPYRTPLLVPFWLHAAAWGLLPATSDWAGTSVIVFATGLWAYTAFTAMTWIHPHRLGVYHASPAAARRSRSLTLCWMSLPLVIIRIYAATRTLVEAGDELHTKTWYNAFRLNPQQATEDGIEDLEYAAHSTFGMLADTGRASDMAWDVVLSVIVIALWVALAEADSRTMFRCTLMPWLKDEDGVAFERQEQSTASWLDTVKQLASVKNLTRFARTDEAPTTATAEAYVRKRGRPPKHRKSLSGNESGYALIRSASKSRSPGRPRKSVSPSKRMPYRARSRSRARSQARATRQVSRGISVIGWEAAGLAWCLAILGGLGAVVIAAFGAEATDFL